MTIKCAGMQVDKYEPVILLRENRQQLHYKVSRLLTFHSPCHPALSWMMKRIGWRSKDQWLDLATHVNRLQEEIGELVYVSIYIYFISAK